MRADERVNCPLCGIAGLLLPGAAWDWRRKKRLAFPGLRLRLEYDEYNDRFGELLPRLGTIKRSLTARTGDFWVLFRLDERLEYQGCAYEYLLLRSRCRVTRLEITSPPQCTFYWYQALAKFGRDSGLASLNMWLGG